MLVPVVYVVRWARDPSGAERLLGWGPSGWREGVVLAAPVARSNARQACAVAARAALPEGWKWTGHCEGPWLSFAGRPAAQRSIRRVVPVPARPLGASEEA